MGWRGTVQRDGLVVEVVEVGGVGVGGTERKGKEFRLS